MEPSPWGAAVEEIQAYLYWKALYEGPPDSKQEHVVTQNFWSDNIVECWASSYLTPCFLSEREGSPWFGT